MLETKNFARQQDQIRIKGLTTAHPIVGGMNWTNIGPRLRLLARRHRHLRFPAIDVDHVDDLRRRLRAGVAGGAVSTLASSVSMRAKRRKFVGALLEAFEPYLKDDLRTATVIKRTMTFKPDELSAVSAARLRREFRANLVRADILDMPGPFVAVLHGEFEPTCGDYVLHWHILTTAQKARALHRLKKKRGYVRTATGSNPIVVRRVRNRVRQFSYLLKSYWPERAIRQTESGAKRDRRHRRIAEPFHSQVLLWLDRHCLSDLVLMNDCWSKRSGGSAAMRQLYLIVHDAA